MKQYQSGRRLINISATGITYQIIVRVLEEVNRDLNMLLEDMRRQKNLNFDLVRKFCVDYLQIDTADLILFSAFDAPQDDIFYQSQDSDDWHRMKTHMEIVPIHNYLKYETSYKFFISALVAAGAAVFKGLEENNIIAQGW
jgi:hypothetical protein